MPYIPSVLIPVHSGKDFSWNGHRGTCSASLLDQGGILPIDIGGRFWVELSTEVLFSLDGEHRNAECKITHWVYRSVTSGMKMLTIIVFND